MVEPCRKCGAPYGDTGSVFCQANGCLLLDKDNAEIAALRARAEKAEAERDAAVRRKNEAQAMVVDIHRAIGSPPTVGYEDLAAHVGALTRERDGLRARLTEEGRNVLRANLAFAVRERDAFAADNAALRANLQAMVSLRHGVSTAVLSQVIDDAIAALSTPTPGDGYVVLTREEADRLDRFLLWAEPPMEEVEKHRAMLRGKVKL